MKFTLIKRAIEAPNVESFVFQPEQPIEWKPGQYFHYTLPHEHADDRGLERWFTVASAPFEGTPMITTRHATDHGSTFKETLFRAQIGDVIEADGPEGDFILDNPNGHYVFLAGGIGITPFHSILKQADHDNIAASITLIYANRDADFPYKQELDAFASRNQNLFIHYLVSPQRIDEQVIQQFVPNLKTQFFYISGPEPMVKGLAETVAGMGVPQEKIKIDDFPGYEAQQG